MRATVLLMTTFALCACADDRSYDPKVPHGDPQRGRTALAEFDCGVCHAIPGVAGAHGTVGPLQAAAVDLQ